MEPASFTSTEKGTSSPDDTATYPTECESSPFVGSDLGFTAKIIFILLGSLEVFAGIVGNSLLLSVLLTPGTRSFHLLFVANLALADLVTTGYWMPFFVLDLLLGRHLVANKSHCVANAFIVYTCGATSVLSLASISLNRYLHVCHSQLYARVFTRARVIVWCLALWIIAVLFTFPPLLGVSWYEYDPVSHTCSMINKPENLYLNIIVPGFCSAPLVLVVHWNLAIFRRWKRLKSKLDARYCTAPERQEEIQPKATPENKQCGENRDSDCDHTDSDKGSQRDPENSEHQRSSPAPVGTRNKYKVRTRERALVRSLCVVVLLMFICFLPFAIIEAIDSSFKQPPEVVIPGVLIFFFNCSVNWIVYGVMNRSIRRGYLSRLRCIGRVCPCIGLK